MSYDYSRQIKTAAGFDPAKVKQIAKLTQANNHDEAYVEGSKMIGATKLAKQFELIGQLVRIEGHLPRPLSDYRYSLYQQMMKHAEAVLEPDQFKQFHAVF